LNTVTITNVGMDSYKCGYITYWNQCFWDLGIMWRRLEP